MPCQKTDFFAEKHDRTYNYFSKTPDKMLREDIYIEKLSQ